MNAKQRRIMKRHLMTLLETIADGIEAGDMTPEELAKKIRELKRTLK